MNKVGFAAVGIAVAFWSVKPVMMKFAFASVGYSEVYLLSAGFGAVVASIVLLFGYRSTLKTVRSSSFNAGAGFSSISGVFLGLWYYGFYRALFETSSASATVVAFSWPALAAISMQFLSGTTLKKLSSTQWVFLGVSFAGVALVSFGGNSSSLEINSGIWWAVVAAVGSGFYLPFSVRAINCFKPSVGNTFFSISISNFTSLVVVYLFIVLTNVKLDYSGLTTSSFVIAAIVGIGIYLLAEILWVWGVAMLKTAAVSFIPYVSPVISVILLWIIFREPLTWETIVGGCLVVTANIVIALVSYRPSKCESQ